MAKLQLVILTILTSIVLPVWADAYYCTNTGRVVSTGVTVDQIIQACGNPSKMETLRSQEPVARQILNQWIYYSKQATAPWDNKLPPELVINFFEDQVQSIEVDGVGMPNGINCFNQGMIQPGDFRSKVLLLCGKPERVQRNTKTIMGPEQTTQRLTYQRNNGLPPVIFEVKEGKLAQIQYGS